MLSSSSHSRSPSPTQEGDITHALSFANNQPGNFRPHKGKQKALPQISDDDEDDDSATQSPSITPYPPRNDEEEETLKVQETLKRWEIAERQRRKAARVSSQSISTPPSLVENVTRRASVLWSSGKKSKSTSGSGLGLGHHAALQTEDRNDILPMGDINISPTPSPTRSETNITSPFADPPQPVSPFADVHRVNSNEEEVPLHAPTATLPQNMSLLSPPPPKSHRESCQPPPPQPLGLPPPRTPPPITNLHYSSTPPPEASAAALQKDDDVREVRWWHEWLCGCGEGLDRGGDRQAGRTNPFE